MSFLGKILTGLIVIISICLMLFSLMVYATHRNWKEDADQLSQQLREAQNLNTQLESQKQSLESQLTAEKDEALRNVAKLESERETLVNQNANIQSDLDELRQEQRSNLAAVASTQANNEKLTAEVETLRTQVREHQQARDDAFSTMVAATDDLHQAEAQLSKLNERNMQLVQELGEKRLLLNESGIDPDSDPASIVPRVRGQVVTTQRTAGNQLIEVTIGSDDGLQPGHTIEVYRGERYLGRAKIIRTEPDRAVGQVLRRFQQGQIQEGDHVATRLRIG